MTTVQLWWKSLVDFELGKLSKFELGFAIVVLAEIAFAWVIAVLGPSMSRKVVIALPVDENELDDKSWVQDNLLLLASLMGLFISLGLAPLIVEPLLKAKSSLYAGMKRDRQRTTVVHGCRAVLEFFATFCFLPLLWPIFVTGTADLSAKGPFNAFAFAALLLNVLYIFELSHRGNVAFATKIHHFAAIVGTALFLDGSSIIPGFTSPTFLCYLLIQGIFVSFEFLERTAIIAYHTRGDRKLVKFLLVWAILDEICCKAALSVLCVGFYVQHWDLMDVSLRVLLLVFSVVLVPAQCYGPYVLLLILKKEEDRLEASKEDDRLEASEEKNQAGELAIGDIETVEMSAMPLPTEPRNLEMQA